MQFIDAHGRAHIKPDGREIIWRPSAYAIIEDRSSAGRSSPRPHHLLMARSVETGLWEFPGGGVEVCETIVQALAREIGEETGYALGKVGELVLAQERWFYAAPYDQYGHAIQLFYRAELDPSVPQDRDRIVREEISDVAWKSLLKLDSGNTQHTCLPVLEMLRSG